MNEILTLHLGSYGFATGSHYWYQQMGLHVFDFCTHQSQEKIKQNLRFAKTFLVEKEKSSTTPQYTPRALWIDTDNNQKLQKEKIQSHIEENRVILGGGGCGNNFARGLYTDGAELYEEVIEDKIRKSLEECEHCQGFSIFHSLGGGTGSGLGSNILQHLSDDYPKLAIQLQTQFPHSKVTDVVIVPYTICLSLQYLLSNNPIIFATNESYACNQAQKENKRLPCLYDMNEIQSSLQRSINLSLSSELQDDGSINHGSLRKMSQTLVTFPRMKIITPLVFQNHNKGQFNFQDLSLQNCWEQYKEYSEPEQLLNSKSVLVSQIVSSNKQNLRAELSEYNQEKFLVRRENQNILRSFFPETYEIPKWNSLNSLEVSNKNESNNSLGLLLNCTGFDAQLQYWIDLFNLMYKRRAFVQYFVGEGMDSMEFDEAREIVLDMIQIYQDMYQEILQNQNEG